MQKAARFTRSRIKIFSRSTQSASIHRTAGGDRPELLDAVAADADVPVVEVDGGVAMAGDEAGLVADLETVGGA